MGPPSFQFAPAQGMPSASLPVPMVSLSMLVQFCRDADGRASLRTLPPHTQQRLLTLLLEKTRAVVGALAQGDGLYGRNHAQCTELLVFALGHATALVASLPPAADPVTPVKKTTSSKKAPPPPPPLGLVRCPTPNPIFTFARFVFERCDGSLKTSRIVRALCVRVRTGRTQATVKTLKRPSLSLNPQP